MAMPEARNLDLNLDPAVPANAVFGQGAVMDVRQMSDKGYDILRGAGAAFTGNIEGSVTGANWTVIAAIAASAQGAIAAQYNYIRLDCTGAGAIGTGSYIKIAGKVL